MSNNFLAYALKRRGRVLKDVYGVKEEVLNYIEKWFNRTEQDLMTSGFDLELLFTFLESQLNEAKRNQNHQQYIELYKIQRNLLVALGQAFFELEYRPPETGWETLEKFGKMIYHTKSDVITFNYDCIVEQAIEKASGETRQFKNGRPFFNWNRYSAYGIKFTKLRMNSDNYWDGKEGRNVAEPFYEKYDRPNFRSHFIKLHGSYNWYQYSEYFRMDERELFKILFKKEDLPPPILDKKRPPPDSIKDDLLCFNGDWECGTMPVWSIDSDKRALEPIIIPPVLYKEEKLQTRVYRKLWQAAKKILSTCEEIVFIGYSFPDTDFYAKKLFLETFAQNKDIKVTLVNPDESIETKFRDLVNFKGTVEWWDDSKAYIENYNLSEAD